MIWDITKEMIFGAKESAAVREQTGEALKHTKQILKVEAAIGKGPLTKEIVAGASDTQKGQIKQYTDDLWENMQEITEQSDWRVQWTGIPWNTTDSDIGTEIKNAFGLTKPPIDVLMKALPIVDGEISTWAKLKSINLRAGISEDATETQRAAIESGLAQMSQALSTITTLEAEKAQLGPEPSAEKKKALRGNRMVHSQEYLAYRKKDNKLNAKIAAANERYAGYKAKVNELNVDLPELIESNVQNTATATDGTATATATDGTATKAIPSKNEFEGGGGFKYVNGKLVRVPTLLDTVLSSISTPSSLREGIQQDYDVRNINSRWGTQVFFTNTLLDWQKIRANTIRLGPWDDTAAGKAHWEHMIRVDNMKIIGLSGRSDAHREANLADPVGYALADLAGSGALDEFVHGTKAANGEAQSIPSSYVGMSTKMLENLTSNQLAEYQRASGTGSPVIFSEGNKTNINSNIVNTANIQAANNEWTQKILNDNNRVNQYNFV